MGKNLLNYTTEIPVEKTIGEIQQVLVKAHATSILAEYDHGAIKAIMFKIKGKNGQELPFRLPAKVEEAYRVMYGDRDPVQKQRYGAGLERTGPADGLEDSLNLGEGPAGPD